MKTLYRIRKTRLIALLTIVFVLGAVIGGGVFALIRANIERHELPGGGENADYATLLSRYGEASELEDYLTENYYLPIDEDAIRTGVLRGLFSAPQDPYTMYYTAAELEAALGRSHGEMSGVGLSMEPDADNRIRIAAVAAGSPAESAGVAPGDILKAVNGESFTGDEILDAVEAARGEPGTEVNLTIEHEGVNRELNIVRSNFISPSVIADTLDGKIGYIRVTSFNLNTAADFEKALTDFEHAGAAGLIIDVRNNNGGLVEQAVQMDDLLLDKGIVAYTVDGEGNRAPLETRDGKTDIPYVVLIDESSISAAEIFALGIKANGGGKLIGETTYGKGIIQKIVTFKKGDGARITIMQYLTPDGAPVHEVGIAPDIVAEKTDEEDVPLDKALNVLNSME